MEAVSVIEIGSSLEKSLEPFLSPGDDSRVITEEQSPDDRDKYYRKKISGVAFLPVHILIRMFIPREYNNLRRKYFNYFL